MTFENDHRRQLAEDRRDKAIEHTRKAARLASQATDDGMLPNHALGAIAHALVALAYEALSRNGS